MNAPSSIESSGVPTALRGPIGGLLRPVLRSLGGDRANEVIASAVPDPWSSLTLPEFAGTLERLGFDVSQGARARERWRQPIDAAIVVESSDGIVSAFAKQGGRIFALTATDATEGLASDTDPEAATSRVGRARRVLHVRPAFSLPLTEFDEDLRKVLIAGLIIAFFTNLVGLAIPLLTMVIYDRVIGGSAPEALPGLAIGGALAIVAVLILRRARARLLAAAHARFGFAIQTRVARRLFRTPLATAGRLQGHAVLARVREAWRVVDPLSHSLSSAMFDAPFIVLSLAAIAWVGGSIVIAPLVYLVVFFGLALLLDRRSRLQLQLAGTSAAAREAMLAELVDKAEDLRFAGIEDAWLGRFAETSRRSAAAAMEAASRSAFIQSAAYVLGAGVALATLAGGVGLVLAGGMSAGGLIATMLIVWRITGPAQALFFGIPRLLQSRSQRERVEALLQFPAEADQSSRLAPAPRGVPALRFDRVGYRAPGASEQSLSGISFTVEPGEVIAVLGPTGSGKSTLLKLAAGLLTPQVGAVLAGGGNVTQFDPDEWRLNVAAYLPESSHVFDIGSEENVALAAPAVAQSALDATLARLGHKAPAADAAWMGLARIQAKGAALAILEGPLSGADEVANRGFAAFIAAARGRHSVLFSTDDPGHARHADKILILNAGQMIYFGPPAKSAGAPASRSQ